MNAVLSSLVDKISNMSAQRQQDAAGILDTLVDQEMSHVTLTQTQKKDVQDRLKRTHPYASKKSVDTFFSKMHS